MKGKLVHKKIRKCSFNDAPTHFIYGYMASDVWYRITQIVREETRCCHFIYHPFQVAARAVLYAPSHRLDSCTIIRYRCHYTKSNPIDDHSNISSKTLQMQNFKPLGHYTCMQCGTSHLQKVQENILSRIILATYRKFTVTTLRFTQNVNCNIYTQPRYQQVANVTV